MMNKLLRIVFATLFSASVANAEVFTWYMNYVDDVIDGGANAIQSITVYYLSSGTAYTGDNALNSRTYTADMLLDDGDSWNSVGNNFLSIQGDPANPPDGTGFYLSMNFLEGYEGSFSRNMYVAYGDVNQGLTPNNDPSGLIAGYYFGTVTVTPVPEPATGALMLAGIGMLIAGKRKRA